MHNAYNSSRDGPPRRIALQRYNHRSSSSFSNSEADLPTMPPLRCAEAMRRGATELASVQLVVGVHTTPARERRQAIRGTWARWRRTTLVCFVVGTKWLPPSVLVPLEQEAEEAGDMVLLHDVFEPGCVRPLWTFSPRADDRRRSHCSRVRVHLVPGEHHRQVLRLVLVSASAGARQVLLRVSGRCFLAYLESACIPIFLLTPS